MNAATDNAFKVECTIVGERSKINYCSREMFNTMNRLNDIPFVVWKAIDETSYKSTSIS